MGKRIALYVKLASEPKLLFTCLKIALVVGLILNLINQGTAIVQLDFTAINWLNIGLTFCVPFLVANYSAVVSKLRFSPGLMANFEVDVTCKNCKETKQHLKANQPINKCPNCGDKTKWKIAY